MSFGPLDSPAVRPLMSLQLRGKKECVALYERKPMVSNFLGPRPPGNLRSQVKLSKHVIEKEVFWTPSS